MSHPSTLTLGSQGSEVERLQQDLSALKYEVEINGSFDANTEAAVKKFQQQNDLKIDGVVGQQTGQKLSMTLKP
ncbi:MAG TPA: peptidoglycan-binding domain-containing protein [Coleofasciculaceae cyanobacterium]|jgi:peptidoglycan hydrolase-like protein with peptidoglycan-binding domain